MTRLRDKRCLIVGGAGGIGAASVRRFVAEGARVVVADLDQPDAEIRDASFVFCDASQPEAVDSLLEQALRLLGGLDILFHVAGGSGRKHGDGPLHECTLDGWHRTLDANLTSTFLTNRAALRQFLAQGARGVILNMASVLALAPSPRFFDTAAYAAAKGGIVSLTRLAAASYADRGIRVNALAPGLIDTPMAARAVQDPAIHSFLVSKQPLARGAGTPEACAEAAVFLCSDEARLVSGVVFPVDGGWTLSEGQYPSQ